MKRHLHRAEQQGSPNFKPPTRNDFHERSSSNMKHHLQRAEHQESPPNNAVIAKKIGSPKSDGNLLRTGETSFAMRGLCGRSETIRDRSDHGSDYEPGSP